MGVSYDSDDSIDIELVHTYDLDGMDKSHESRESEVTNNLSVYCQNNRENLLNQHLFHSINGHLDWVLSVFSFFGCWSKFENSGKKIKWLLGWSKPWLHSYTVHPRNWMTQSKQNVFVAFHWKVVYTWIILLILYGISDCLNLSIRLISSKTRKTIKIHRFPGSVQRI